MKNEGKLSDGVKSLSIINKLQPEQKLTLLFDICCEFKLEISHWYQREVTKKRYFSLIFIFLIMAAISIIIYIQILMLPFLTNAEKKLWFTQISFGLLSISLLLLMADRAFRWTAGWTNYINAIMAIDIRYAEFITLWIKNDAANATDMNKRYGNASNIAGSFINDLMRIQQQETQAWSAQLSDTIKQFDEWFQAEKQRQKKE